MRPCLQVVQRPGPRRVAGLFVPLLLAGCAATTPTTPLPEEVVVVLNTGDASLTLLPVTDPAGAVNIPLGAAAASATGLAARAALALVATGTGRGVQLVDLQNRRVSRTISLAFDPGGLAILNDSVAYVVGPGANVATRLKFLRDDTASVAVGQAPVAVAAARGRVFVLNANLEAGCGPTPPCVLGESWLTVIDPERNVVTDSVALPGPGNGTAVTVGGDGLLYVLSAGPGDVPARLHIVDPVRREEVGSFGGIGVLPGTLAPDSRERVYITSLTEGLMEFNTRTRRVVRGAGAGIPLQDGVAAAVDANGQVYAVETGGCAFPIKGRIRVFRPDLTEARILAAGVCAAAAAIVRLPPIPAD